MASFLPQLGETELHCKGVGDENTSIRGESSPLVQKSGAICVGVSGSSEIGKEVANDAAILPTELPVIDPSNPENDEQLVEVAIQPGSFEQKVVQQRRKFTPKKSKTAISSVPEDMV
ncbi:4-hydroxy-3-methylbut-2-enyl diphosphatereductase [Striga asiatica]|uniref:4-hydroxy-3-methylbut-2-enyl diphosphatereductase n=1 Tax=Striga asiatica TaxID=4170 RepID=A0A5A7QTY0_STRAF|nr:4-hydroxy-3-methylbut-2-enyl diphosphatereductase [Striga asiatica]